MVRDSAAETIERERAASTVFISLPAKHDIIEPSFIAGLDGC